MLVHASIILNLVVRNYLVFEDTPKEEEEVVFVLKMTKAKKGIILYDNVVRKVIHKKVNAKEKGLYLKEN